MRNTFDPLLNPIDPAKASVLHIISRRARMERVPFMLFGAFARELHFYHTFDIEGGRSTTDIDLSIQVPDWPAYNLFRRALKKDGFQPGSEQHPEKLFHDETGQELDLLPFGEIAGEGATIRWPVDDSPWSVIGLEDAFANADMLPLTDSAGKMTSIAVAPIPALAMLKMVAISDRPHDRFKRDGTDIAFIIERYPDAGNRERLLRGSDADVMRLVRNDLTLAGARLLGRDIARMTGTATRSRVVGLLEHEMTSTSRCFLSRGLTGRVFPSFSAAREAVLQISAGVNET